MRRCLPLLTVLMLAALPASAQSFPIITGFHSVLAFGEGEGTSDQDLAAFEATGAAPAADLNEDSQYEGIEQAWPGFTDADLNTYYRDSDFLAQPTESSTSGLGPALGSTTSGSPPAVETINGATVIREAPDDVPVIYGSTRGSAMYAAGYVTAEDRMFLMDVLRHTAEGTTAELLGSSAAPADSTQLGLQDASTQQLTSEMMALPQTEGAQGTMALNDIQNYIAGINAFIAATKTNPALLPAEYTALGITLQPWTLADTAAVGIYLIGQETVFGGDQGQQAEALRMMQQTLGARRGTVVYNDLRQAAAPGAVTTLTQRFSSDNPGTINPRSEAIVDPGSLVARDTETGGPVQSSVRRADPGLPAWAQTLARVGIHLPHMESNAVLVDAKRSGDGQAIAAMGPQVDYYTPEIFLEYEMHAPATSDEPGIDVSGVSFPGASPYPLIGHGIDYAWTGTSAYSANEDVFAEKLCNADGSAASFTSTAYLYRGRCTPFATRTITETTPVAPTSPSLPQTITQHTLNSVHGPITDFATVHGVPVALATAIATDNHEIPSYVAFMQLAENVPTSPQSFITVMHQYTGSENWYFVDQKDIAVFQSGSFPIHAKGTNPDLPIWGTGQYDWKGFRPSTYGYDELSLRNNPVSIDPKQGYLVNWNNALAPGRRVAAGDWENGPVVRATMLNDLLSTALKHRTLTLTGLTGMVTAPSVTADPRGFGVWPWLHRVLGSGGGANVRQLVNLLNGWYEGGSQRRSTNGENVVDDSPAVLLMDAWWPLLVRAEFQPVIGASTVNFIDANFDSLVPSGLNGSGDAFFSGWMNDVQEDMRDVLHQRGVGHFSRVYCGNGSLTRCRTILQSTLQQAATTLAEKYGVSQDDWKLPVTCPVTTPVSCNQEIPTSAGAISIPPQPFDNRGTFYQADAITAHRP